MEDREALKKLIPMEDDEMENIPPRDFKLNAPTLMEASSILNSPSKTIYGDFSLNSFIIVDTPLQEPEAIQEDGVNVYMESILDLFKSLNMKIDRIGLQKSVERQALEEIQKNLFLNDTKKAMETVNKQVGECSPDLKDIMKNFLERQWPGFLLDIKGQVINVQDIWFNLKSIHEETESRLIKKLEENDRLKNIINQQNIDHRAQIDSLISENNSMKDGVIKLIKDLNPSFSFDSQLEEDVLVELRNLMGRKNEVIDDLRMENIKREDKINEYKKKANNFEISHLNSQVNELKTTQKKLQDENLNLTSILNKMSEKNIKLKQELVFFHNEMKKALDSINKKNETISRQKSLIEMFQEKLSGSQNFPIEELRRRKYEIEDKLTKETDYFTKQTLKREKEDCEKRLSDFLKLNARKSV